MKNTLQPLILGAFFASQAIAGAPAAAGEPFVHFAGATPPALVLADTVEGTNPSIEHLLSASSDLWERIRLGFGMADLDRALIEQQISWYAARPELVQAIVARGRQYLHFIVDEVERRGLPTELALLPFIESGFNPMAVSSARAAGLWQFIPETGLRYKLAQTPLYDGRRDVVASTGAALDYLEFLYRHNHNDWHRALASYNWGESAVARAVDRNRARGLPDAYESLSMPEETRHYVPRLLAIKSIIRDPAAFGVALPELANQPVFRVVRITSDLELNLAAQFADMPLAEFLKLNPAFNSRHVPAGGGAALAIPLDKAEAFKVNLERHRESLGRPSGPAGKKAPTPSSATRF
jgi:membrane-bound lytic murein transglycosylase D